MKRTYPGRRAGPRCLDLSLVRQVAEIERDLGRGTGSAGRHVALLGGVIGANRHGTGTVCDSLGHGEYRVVVLVDGSCVECSMRESKTL